MEDRLVEKDILSKIKKEQYYKVGIKSTICVLTLENGFEVRGESGVINPDNYDEEIGNKISKQRAIDKIWFLEGYLLQQKLYEEKNKVKIQGGGLKILYPSLWDINILQEEIDKVIKALKDPSNRL